jgi:hypothetical protein
MEGGINTSYFFAVANQRKRKKCISSLIDEGVTLTDNKEAESDLQLSGIVSDPPPPPL